MSATVKNSQMQSRKVHEELAKKQEEEAAEKRDALLSIIQNPPEDFKENVQIALKNFYEITINKCSSLLASGNIKEIFKTINILKTLLADGHNIDYIITRLLCNGNLLFFQFVKQVRRDLLNHFEAYDEIVHTCKPNEIIELLKFGVLELQHAATINKMESLESTIYMFIQLTDYEDTIQDYLWQTYPKLIYKQGLLRQMVLCNIPHEIAVYLKSLGVDEFNESFVNFSNVLKSYEVMEEKYKGSPMLKGRLVNLIRMIIDMVFNQGFKFPNITEFLEAFKKIYTIKNYADLPVFMELLPRVAYNYISMRIYQLNIENALPYDTLDGKCA